MDSQILSIGKASIFNTYPDWLPVQVNPNYNHVPGPTHAVDGQPIPTNNWFSPLFWWVNDLDYDNWPDATHGTTGAVRGSAIALRPMPAMYQVSPWGLMLTYRHNPEIKCGGEGDQPPCGWPSSTQEMGCSNWTNWRSDRDPNAIFAALVISVDGLLVNKPTTPFFVNASDFGDWDATLHWDDGQRQLSLTTLAGSPMLYGRAIGGELEFQLPAADALRPITVYDSQGHGLGQAFMGAPPPGLNLAAATDGVLGLSFTTLEGDTVYYAIFAPQGTTWSFAQGTTDTSHNPGRGGYLSKLKSTNLAGQSPIAFTVAVLPEPPSGVPFPVNALRAFAQAAGFHVAKTTFTWDPWDTQSSTITAHYAFAGQTVGGAIHPSVITTLFKPHQNLLGSAAPYLLNEAGDPYTYNSPRGPLKVIQLPVDPATSTAQYSVTYPYYGYVPILPDPGLTGDDLTTLTTYLAVDSSQTTAATADFLKEDQPDAYATGTKLYYKMIQLALWLKQFEGVETIPNWRNSGQSVAKVDAIQLIVDFLKADLETFFSATRPSQLAYQWHYFNPAPGDASGFKPTSLPAGETLPLMFPCPGNSQCNPNGDPLRSDLQTGPYWTLTQQDLIDAHQTGVNPYLVMRGLDFTVNALTHTGPSVDTLLHFAWKQTSPTQTQNVVLFVFVAPTAAKADPKDLSAWKQCIWTSDTPRGSLNLHTTSSYGLGAWSALDNASTPWRIGSIPYNGTSTVAPNRLAPDIYDILVVIDCGANCQTFPTMCTIDPPPLPPDVSNPIWSGWELTLGPVHFEGKINKFIAYNPQWNTLLGNYSWYGSIENLSDHHFGWGYLIKAAALVAQLDTTLDPDTQKPWWDVETGWGGIVNLLIRDVMDWRKPGEVDPLGLSFGRCKYLNPVEGHMYANGHGNGGDGNDEESSSEAVNFANACLEWGTVTNQPEIRDLGILLRSMYAQAVPLYWFNVDGDVLPSTTADQPFPMAAQITGAGNRHDTFFSGGGPALDHGCSSRNSDVVAIETLPVTAGTLRLTLFTPQLKVAWDTVMKAGGPYCGAQVKCYLSTLLCFQALFDPATAKASLLRQADPQQPFTAWYNTSPSTGGLKQPEDHSYAAAYAFICSLGQLGGAKADCLSSPDLNPFYMPMADGSVLIYNYKSTQETYHIGGTAVTVPPWCCLRVPLS
jgi:hypothetical protein